MVPMYKVVEVVKRIRGKNPNVPIAIRQNDVAVGVVVGDGTIVRAEQLGLAFTNDWVRPFMYQVLESVDPNEADEVMRPLIDLFT